MIFHAKIESGEMKVMNRAKVIKMIQGMKDGMVEVTLKYKNRRSNRQNRYLHGLLIPEFRKALVSVGYGAVKTDEQAKDIMKSMFLTTAISNDTGAAPVHFVKDTSSLSKEEMSILIEDVIQFAAENMNYRIPYPNEQLEAGF